MIVPAGKEVLTGVKVAMEAVITTFFTLGVFFASLKISNVPLIAGGMMADLSVPLANGEARCRIASTPSSLPAYAPGTVMSGTTTKSRESAYFAYNCLMSSA